MKKVVFQLIILIPLIGFHLLGLTQTADSTVYKKKIFRAVVDGNKGDSKGYLINSNDTAVFISLRPLPFKTLLAEDVSVRTIEYRDVKTISIHRKGNAGRVALYGFATGAFIGIAAGFIEGNKGSSLIVTSEGFAALVGGALGGLSGAIIGTLIGALTSHKFIINGQKQNLHKMNEYILKKVKISTIDNY